MEQSFDPHYEWLGIPPEERPINHYRLLGIREFESNATVISNAADRQMAHVRNFSSGPRSAESQQVLNELSVARVCLLNPTKKAAYDAELQAQQAMADQPEVGLDWIPASSESAPTATVRRSSGANPIAFLVRVVLGGVVGIGGALLWIYSSGSPEKRDIELPDPNPPQKVATQRTQPPPKPTPRQPRPNPIALRTPERPKPLEPLPPPAETQVTICSVEKIHKLSEHENSVFAIALSPDKKFLISGGADRQAILWDTQTWQAVAANKDIPGKILGTCFSSDGNYAFVGGDPRQVLALEVPSLKLLRKLEFEGRPSRLVSMPSQSQVIASGFGEVQARDYLTGQSAFRFHPHGSQNLALCVTSDGSRIYTAGDISGTKDRFVVLAIQAGSDQPLGIAPLPHRPLRMKFGRSEQELLVASGPEAIFIDLSTGRKKLQWHAPSDTDFHDFSYWPEHDLYVTSSRAGIMAFWKPGASEPICQCQASATEVYHALPIDDETMVTCSRQKRLALVVWKVSIENSDGPFRIHTETPTPTDPLNPNAPIDLLEQFDLAKHARHGSGWKRTEDGLETGFVPFQEGGPSAWAIAEFDFEPPEEYRVEAIVRRALLPNGEPKGVATLAFGAIVNGEPVTLQLDAFNPPLAGLEEVNNQRLPVNATRREGRLLSLEGKNHLVVYTVLKDRFQLTVDGRTILDWDFPADTRFQIPTKPLLENPRHFWFGTWSAGFVISKLEFFPLLPTPRQTLKQAERPIDVLAVTQSNPASMTGEHWTLKPEGLLFEPPERTLARYQTSIPFPKNYRIEMTLKRVLNSFGQVKGNQGFDIGLLLNDRPCLLGLDLMVGRYSQIQTIHRGGPSPPGATVRGRLLSEVGREHSLACTVNDGRVTVDFDNRRIMNWSIQISEEVPISPQAKTLNPRAFWLRSYQSSILVTELRFIPLSDSKFASPSQRTKNPAPTEEQLAQPRQQIQLILGEEISALITQAEKAQFAAKLLHEVVPATTEPQARYALLELVVDYACQGDNVQLAITAVQQIISEYQVNPFEHRAALARKIHEIAPSSEARQHVAALMIELVSDAADAKRWEIVDEFLVLAMDNARRSRNKAVLNQAVSLHQRLEDDLKEWKQNQ